jgi:L-ascorbate metabolism protein UlaG (beta-lactamase superfamily)
MNNRRTLLLTALVLFLTTVYAACSEKDTGSKGAGDSAADSYTKEQSSKSGDKAVTIHWWGQSCFSHTIEGGFSVINDPVPTSYGFPAITVEPAVCMISHTHPDHNAVTAVPGSPEVIQGTGDHQAAGMTFKGVATFHDDNQGASRGANTVFVWEMEGVHIVHLGDLGHLLTDEQIQQIGTVDVLMIPVGGNVTIDGPKAVQVAQQLSAKLIIPMHYNAGSSQTAFLAGIDPFLQTAPSDWTVEKPDSTSVTVKASDFTAQSTKVVVLKVK